MLTQQCSKIVLHLVSCSHLPKICQAFLMSATLSEDVKALKKMVLHNPVSYFNSFFNSIHQGDPFWSSYDVYLLTLILPRKITPISDSTGIHWTPQSLLH